MYAFLEHTHLKKVVATFMIISLLVMTPPKRTDAIIVLLVGLSVGAVVADLIILCAVGVICGGGGGGGTPGTGGPGTPGEGCNSPANSCGEFTGGTYDSAGVCSAVAPSDWNGPGCTSGPNYCGMTASGNEHCSGDGRCSVSTPADNLCIGRPLPEDAITINPTIVRVGDDANDDIVITWNTGENFPTNCTLTGPGLPSGFAITTTTGSVTVEDITGQREYQISCGVDASGNPARDSETVRVLPALFES